MKTMHMMTFCPTTLSYLLSAANQTLRLLALLFDVLTNANIKPEERSNFFSPKSLIILHILTDSESVLLLIYLTKVDKDDT